MVNDTNDQFQMTSDEPSSHETRHDEPGPSRSERGFDLGERTERFADDVIRFARTVPLDVVTVPLVGQLVKAGTSVGANYCEADEAGSKKEFRYRISVCRRESRESKYWLRKVAVALQTLPRDLDAVIAQARVLWKEADELNRIFATIHRRSDRPSH
ncbi:MAG TPA: four helix bundle protein [Planctomycetaceae bacterium]|nr:four helix bundle protein [Planctomycetaceae bacterium]